MNIILNINSPSEDGLAILREVKDGLLTKQTLGYENSVKAFKICHQYLGTEIVQHFLQNCFLQMVTILTDQIPSKIGPYEKTCVEESLTISTSILLKLLPSKPTLSLQILTRVFDKAVPFYAGGKTYWTSFPGNPHMRYIYLKAFADGNGFQFIHKYLKDANAPWIGADALCVIVKGLLDVEREMSPAISFDVVDSVMKSMLNITEDQLKKESTDTIHSLIHAILQKKNKENQFTFHSFWMDHTLKLLNTQSIVLKLFAWEQINELTREAISSRPVPKRYSVVNAGNPVVNGVYDCQTISENEAPRYTREFIATDGSKHTLTLFRCAMRSKQKWWFISEADLKCPGTDKDIDYYQHKSTIDQEREPPCSGWITATSSSGASPGRDPPPNLERMEPYIKFDNIPDDHVLINRLQNRVFQEKILDQVFGSSMHREIISRSSKLLVLLAEMRSLKPEHIQSIWKASLISHESEVIDEIHSLLVLLSQYLSEDLFNYFMALIQETLDSSSDEGLLQVTNPTAATANNSNMQKIIQFISKIDLERQRYFRNLSQKSNILIVALVWNTLNRADESLKTHNAGSLETLLLLCLAELHDKSLTQSFIIKCIKEAVKTIESVVAATSPNTSATSSVSAMASNAHINRIVYALHFMMSSVFIDSTIIDALEADTPFSAVIFNDIVRYVDVPKPLAQKTAAKLGIPFVSLSELESFYKSQLLNRIDLLRCYYGSSLAVKMPKKMIVDLAGILVHHPIDREPFFTFLQQAAVKLPGHKIDAAYDISVSVYVFSDVICNPSIDWTTCGGSEFQCFKTYFTGLQTQSVGNMMSATQLVGNPLLFPTSTGLNTLWRITLSVPSPQVAKSSISLLLKTYDDLMESVPGAHYQLLENVFSRLDAAASSMKSVTMTGATNSDVFRCIEILLDAISRFKGQAPACHAVRGSMSRVKIIVRYPRNLSAYYGSQYDTRHNDKQNYCSFIAEVHPFHTLLHLKHIIAAQAEFYSISKVAVEKNGKLLTGDSTILSKFDIVDGSEFTASVTGMGHTTFDEDDEPQSVAQVGGLIASSKKYFDCLVGLIESFESVGQHEASKLIWDLIQLIPTQSDMLNEIEVITKKNDGQSWDGILTLDSLSRSTYNLQIIDSLLQPAHEFMNDVTYDNAQIFKEQFIRSGGFLAVLNYFVAIPSGTTQLIRVASSVAVHILHFCLFDRSSLSPEKDISIIAADSVDEVSISGAASADTLLPIVQSNSSAVVEKLLQVANYAAAAEESGVVSDALMTITHLMQSPGVASQLTENPEAKSLLAVVLRSNAPKVRAMAADFAIEIGKSQPVVFDWLVSELQQMEATSSVCGDVFRAIISLIEWSQTESTNDLSRLATVVYEKLLLAEELSGLQDELSDKMLHGCLQVLAILVGCGVNCVLEKSVQSRLVSSLLKNFLLAMPTPEKDKRPVCVTTETRQAAFSALLAYVKHTPLALDEVVLQIRELSSFAADTFMEDVYNCSISFDVKKPNIEFVGLKNQGCTCYLNSLIQQLFMCKTFREAVLSTPLKDTHRTTLWHHDNNDLVGKELMFEWSNGCWEKARVNAFYEDTGEHGIIYETLDGKSVSDEIRFVLKEGRFQKETGRVRLLPDANDVALTEREESAERVLEQLQRTFCFMKSSKRRYFDPKPFVEACKSLNLNFNVYHQNDASEFFDNLLDRLETAMKGKSTGNDIWKTFIQKSVFGGKMLYQKIPTECATYQAEKRDCGHWRGSRRESFLKVELIIRGKEKIEDSLDELVKGELMDGDNKIMCDVCNEKKTTVRRTCFGVLSNLLILHLKRFDLDFQTFETVKLNNRIAFPTSINMYKYTKEGMEAEEQRQQQDLGEGQSSKATQLRSLDLQYDDRENTTEKGFDPLDYEYELNGVLVHAGVAQGGHYYSFIRDKDVPDRWYRFDDEDVSPFHPDNIPNQCYGGTVTTNVQGVSSMIEEDRSANALMLFFDKVRPIEVVDEDVIDPGVKPASVEVKEDKVDSPTAVRLIDGYQAFDKEVWEANREHIVTTYLVDGDLHSFVRNMLAAITSINVEDAAGRGQLQTEWDNEKTLLTSVLSTVQFGTHFLLDIVLHCRERTSMKTWLVVFRDSFTRHPFSAEWLVRHLLSPTCPWLKDFLLTCTDPLARATFVQLISQAIASIAPSDSRALQALLDRDSDTLNSSCMSEPPPPDYLNCLLVLFLHAVMDLLIEVPYYTRYADELFMLIRELSAIPALCNAMLASDMVGRLAYFAMRDRSPEKIRQYYHVPPPIRQNNMEQNLLLPSVFEALSALLGVPQSRKVCLLEEQVNPSEPQLTPDVKAALTTIFHEVARLGSMDMRDIIQYWDRIFCNTQKMTNIQAKGILDRYETNAENRLTLEGFLRRYADVAMYNPKSVWQDLAYFGFQNDLKRVKDVAAAGVVAIPIAPEAPSLAALPESSRQCLVDLALYEAGLDAAEGATVAIAKRVSTNDGVISTALLKQALKELYRTVREWAWSPAVDMIFGLIRVLVTISDPFETLRIEQVILGDFGMLKVIAAERISHRDLFSFFIRYSRAPASTQPRGLYDDYDSNRSVSSRYLEFIQELRNASGAMSKWISEQAAVNSDMKWLKTQIQPVPALKTIAVEEEADLMNVEVLVEGAGTDECNGIYRYKMIVDDVAMFQKTSLYHSKPVVFNLYRCRMNDNTHRWFISITPGGREPGTSSDEDFYSANAVNDRIYSLDDRFPPKEGWIKCKGDALDPCPVLSWRAASGPATVVDDRDDTLAVVEDDVNDDSFSSFPGTPVGERESIASSTDVNTSFASI